MTDAHAHNRSIGSSPHRSIALRALTLCALGLVALFATACGELEPMVEPEIVDLQLTLDTLRTQVRDAQRNLAEVRAELESRRQELADSQVARAQLEGRVREAERRVSEARHVIEVQREELLAARAERERVFRSSLQLRSQMKQFQKKATIAFPATRAANAGAMIQDAQATEIIVKPGDTLWSLARTHRIGLNRLRAINDLTDDQIEAGQVLLLSEHRAMTGSSAETNPGR